MESSIECRELGVHHEKLILKEGIDGRHLKIPLFEVRKIIISNMLDSHKLVSRCLLSLVRRLMYIQLYFLCYIMAKTNGKLINSFRKRRQFFMHIFCK